jgi:hypothetical protein
MAGVHPVFQTSIPVYSSCLEYKMAFLNVEKEMSGTVSRATGGLIDGDFDVEKLLTQLTIEEKASLLAGTVAIYSRSIRNPSNNIQERISGIPRRSHDWRSPPSAPLTDPMASAEHTSLEAHHQHACLVALPLERLSTKI